MTTTMNLLDRNRLRIRQPHSFPFFKKIFFNTLSDEIQFLDQLHIPILIIWGQEEKSLPVRCAEKMYRLLHGSKLEVIPDAGHLANFDRPKVFNQIAIDFLNQKT